MRYVVYDDALLGNAAGWTPDSFADALRGPLAAIGVRVVRQKGTGSAVGKGGPQGGEGMSPNVYKAKLVKVEHIIEGIMTFRPPRR